MDEKIEKDAINPNNGNENSNNKTNTFNLIIGIATLLIAILGATFAYFSATARGNENGVTLQSAFVSISYDEGTEIEATNLIPATVEVALSKFERSDIEAYDPETNPEGKDKNYDSYDKGDVNRRCVDAKGKEVCYVYQFSIKSDSVAEYTDIVAYIVVNQNEFENLSYVLYEVEYETEMVETDTGTQEVFVEDKYGIKLVKEGGYKVVSDFPYTDSDSENFSKVGYEKFERITGTVEGGAYTGTVTPKACLFGRSDDFDTKDSSDSTRCKEYSLQNRDSATNEVITHYYQLVIWLNETHEEQDEQGKTFHGTVVIEATGGLDAAEYENGHITGQK